MSFISGVYCGKTIAHHNPLDIPLSGVTPASTQLPDHFRVFADPDDVERLRVEPGQHVQIDETVIERSDENVCPRMDGSVQPVVVTSCVYDDGLVGGREFGQPARKEFVGVLG